MDPIALRDALRRLALSHRWTWRTSLVELLDSLPTADGVRHPVVAVDALDDEMLATLIGDDARCAAVHDELAALDTELAGAPVEPEIVYYSPEFGISERIAQYSGGLGILAGDHVKAAHDLGTPLAAVGLCYREGFFRQELRDGGQTERYDTVEPSGLGALDTGIVVDVPIADRVVRAAVLRLDVGRVPMLLLDTDLAGNAPADRAITDRLYGGDRRHRLEQEMVLGVGGARAVEAMGWSPAVHHLNEGHAGFLALELIDRELRRGTPGIGPAVQAIRGSVLFTTHTPVPAGIDRFDRELVEPHLRPWAERWGASLDEVAALGRDPDAGDEVFNMAVLCLGVASRANGVSRLHGEVSRELFARVPGGSAIGSVTNGVHARTWVHPELQRRFDEWLGAGWDLGDPQAWRAAASIGDDELRSVRRTMRTPLRALLESHGAALDDEAAVIGFARRFATYKRADLLLRDLDRLTALLADDARPVHLVFAGKAHPADGAGKALIERVVAFSGRAAANGRFTFVPDYDVAVARAMYAGSDVWLNTPIRPREASGTSGEKAALNGALNCSIPDGWWAEMTDGRNGWDIATSDATDDDERDDAEAAATLDALVEVAATFHADGTGSPSADWLDRVRHVWTDLGPKVTSARMVRDYWDTYYAPMIAAAGR